MEIIIVIVILLLINKNALQNIDWKLATILPRHQCRQYLTTLSMLRCKQIRVPRNLLSNYQVEKTADLMHISGESKLESPALA